MKKNITILATIAVLAIVVYFISNNNNSVTTVESVVKSEDIQQKNDLNINPKRKQSYEVVGSKEIIKNSDDSKRLVPKTTLDHKLRTTQEVIEEKGYGTFPPVDMKNMNAHKEHVLTALQNPKENSGSISIVGKREKFDLEKFKENPKYYLDTVEPGRAFDAANPGVGIAPIERIGNSSLRTKQNDTVKLEAKVDSNMPVSFTAFDGGHFQNGLGFITVQADSSGNAYVEFTPTEGVINQARVRAASPVNSGTLQWNVFVELKNQNN